MPLDENLTPAELRRKRLVALGIIASSAERVESRQQKEVIDLLGDSDDDSNSEIQAKPSAPKPTVKRAAGKKKATNANASDSFPNELPSRKRLKSTPNTSFQVATWNVWFGHGGDGRPNPSVRMRALCSQLLQSSSNLWFIGFQEVVNELWEPHITSHLSKSYKLYRQAGCAYGCAMAVHNSLTILDQGFVPYTQSKMGRGILYVRARLPGGGDPVLFTTTHLESFNGKNDAGGPQRARQCRELRDFCERKGGVSIATGDMNWDDYLAPRSRRQLQDESTMMSIFHETKGDWKDSWLELNPKDPGYTYDPKENPMLGGGNLRRRFDRCFVRNLSCTETELLGTQQIGDLTFEKYNSFTQKYTTAKLAPSDHFGYRVTLQI